MAQSVKHPTSARVMIPWLVSSSPVWGSALTTEPALDSVSPSLYPSPAHTLSLKKTNIKKKKKKKEMLSSGCQVASGFSHYECGHGLIWNKSSSQTPSKEGNVFYVNHALERMRYPSHK